VSSDFHEVGPLKDAITEVHVSKDEEEKNGAYWRSRGQNKTFVEK
jgi:hypothetical protein